MPSFYLALEPPLEEASRIADVMRQLGDRSPLPHVTVIPPQRLRPDLTWLPVVRDVIAESPTVTVALGEVGTFHDRVLYLTVEATNLASLHFRLLEALRNREVTAVGDVEERDFVPHLTLAVARRGRALPDYAGLASVLHDLPPFEATEVTVCRRVSAKDHYVSWQKLPLSANRQR